LNQEVVTREKRPGHHPVLTRFGAPSFEELLDMCIENRDLRVKVFNMLVGEDYFLDPVSGLSRLSVISSWIYSQVMKAKHGL
jgi:hypothetical protein